MAHVGIKYKVQTVQVMLIARHYIQHIIHRSHLKSMTKIHTHYWSHIYTRYEQAFCHIP